MWGCNQKKGEGGGLDVKVGGIMRGSKRRRRRGRGEEEEGRGGWVDEGMHHSDERVRLSCTRARVHTSACVHWTCQKKYN